MSIFLVFLLQKAAKFGKVANMVQKYWPKLQCQNDSKFTKKYLNTKESQTILEEMQQVVEKQLNFGEENSLKETNKKWVKLGRKWQEKL